VTAGHGRREGGLYLHRGAQARDGLVDLAHQPGLVDGGQLWSDGETPRCFSAVREAVHGPFRPRLSRVVVSVAGGLAAARLYGRRGS
jgi:hypothetical protein